MYNLSKSYSWSLHALPNLKVLLTLSDRISIIIVIITIIIYF